MAALNPLARELALKIVFYGPGLGGKTTTLQHIHDAARAEHRGKMVSLATAVDRTLYFDFLPVRVPHVRGMNVRLQLFTVPGQVYYDSTRKLVLSGADGIVFVADSQEARSDANMESFLNLRENLREQERDLANFPLVMQYNKRDLPDVLSVEELERELNIYNAPRVLTVATEGKGVFETLEMITRAAVGAFDDSLPVESKAPASVSLPQPEGGLTDALRDAEPRDAQRTVAIMSKNVLESRLPDSGDGEELLGEADEIPESSTVIDEPPTRVPVASSDPPPPAAPLSSVDSLPPAPVIGGPLPIPPPVESDVVSEIPESDTLEGEEPDELPPYHPPANRTRVPTTSFSLAALWPPGVNHLVRDAEEAIGQGNWPLALEKLDSLVGRSLAASAALLGSNEAPKDVALVPLLLGMDGPRYLAFRALVRDVRAGANPEPQDVLAAYAFALELNLARGRARL